MSTVQSDAKRKQRERAPEEAEQQMDGKKRDGETTDEAIGASERDNFHPACSWAPLTLTITVFGASGDLARKKTFPALFALFKKNFLSPSVRFIGYARSNMTNEALHERIRPLLSEDAEEDEDALARFLERVSYVQGAYDSPEGFQKLAANIEEWEQRGAYDLPEDFQKLAANIEEWEQARSSEGSTASGAMPRIGRLMYLALPSTTYPEVAPHLRRHCCEVGSHGCEGSWCRIIMEKPFGKDLCSSEALVETIGQHFNEAQLYRIDHYLGKELVQNLLMMRFANSVMASWWNRQYVDNVQIIFKENFGTGGRGGYFDQYGIVRDVIQNHLMQVFSLIAMEAPVSMHPDDVRDEKVKVMRCVSPVKPEGAILGQYVAGKGEPGYLDDPTVPPGSTQATYAAVRLNVNNERWAGVPFMIKAGKALNESVALVRMQLKTPAASLFGDLEQFRNEVVIRFQPGEAIYVKVVVKKPGLDVETEMSELDLTYPERYSGVVIPGAYERLILDCIRGDAQHFVRRDELRASWAIMTPLIHAMDKGLVPVEPYEFGSRGPKSVDAWTEAAGYKRTEYVWQQPPGVCRAQVEAFVTFEAAGVPTVPISTPRVNIDDGVYVLNKAALSMDWVAALVARPGCGCFVRTYYTMGSVTNAIVLAIMLASTGGGDTRQVLTLALMQLHMLRHLAEVSSTSSHWGEQEHHGMHWGEALRGQVSQKVAVLSLLPPAAMQAFLDDWMTFIKSRTKLESIRSGLAAIPPAYTTVLRLIGAVVSGGLLVQIGVALFALGTALSVAAAVELSKIEHVGARSDVTAERKDAAADEPAAAPVAAGGDEGGGKEGTPEGGEAPVGGKSMPKDPAAAGGKLEGAVKKSYAEAVAAGGKGDTAAASASAAAAGGTGGDTASDGERRPALRLLPRLLSLPGPLLLPPVAFVLSIPVARGANWFLSGGGRRMDEEEATAAAAERIAAAAEDGTSLPVRLATDVVRFLYGGTGRREPADGGVVSASLLNAKPAVGGIGVEPRGGGVLRVLFTVASDAVADTVVRWRHELRRCVDSTAVFDVLSDREEAQHQALWPAFLAAKVAGKRAQFHRARLVVDGERVFAGLRGLEAAVPTLWRMPLLNARKEPIWRLWPPARSVAVERAGELATMDLWDALASFAEGGGMPRGWAGVVGPTHPFVGVVDGGLTLNKTS
ncbi:hypothetical protein FOA52_002966 [Chlamydomonas sp. UWO 241]|nr:hypothetical protein FOA52_002966 [Chlamydomonas sp. UWO 241]